MARGIGGTKKRGSKVKVQCPICGVVLTKAGMVGHLRILHHRDHKAPLMPIQAEPYITKLEKKVVTLQQLLSTFVQECPVCGQRIAGPENYAEHLESQHPAYVEQRRRHGTW